MKSLLIAASLTLAAALTATLTAPASAAGPAQPAAADADKATLTVRFEQIESPTGLIMLSVFDSEAAYDSGSQPVWAGAAKVESGTVSVIIAGLAPGRYAIKAFHDVDGDGQMKTNPFGMPLEPFAFSNNARPEGGPARWQAASFDVPAGASETRIAIQ